MKYIGAHVSAAGPFLEALKASGKQRILLTNAHPHNLAVKLEHTGLDAD